MRDHRNHDVNTDELKEKLRFQRIIAILGATVSFALLLLYLLWTPITGPWAKERQGMANFRQATQERKILVEQARGELLAAEDQAAAIRTMGKAAREFPEYRQQMFIQAFNEALAEGRINKIVYLPVEAPLPITEAGRGQ